MLQYCQKRKWPRGCGCTPGPGPQPLPAKEAPVDTPTIRPEREKVAELRLLEERLKHELMDDEERQVLRDRVLALRRRLSH
jgi:hypothetical protein